ncbi:hypothetical protein BB559_004408 [Furculomyces boomerangus]|uniref:J domain-containing protein n=1 Tax=Furculomyces boomerangus TaxID=61424 RepID=A0A2T9YF15_9FUNG|nr:hypothetical protein BB559_004408 [Furculomyces boomerangus]
MSTSVQNSLSQKSSFEKQETSDTHSATNQNVSDNNQSQMNNNYYQQHPQGFVQFPIPDQFNNNYDPSVGNAGRAIPFSRYSENDSGIVFTNIENQETVFHRFLIVHGKVNNVSTGNGMIHVTHPYFPPMDYPVIEGHFKAIVELERGDNNLLFSYTESDLPRIERPLLIKMQPNMDDPPLLLAIIIGSDSKGEFDMDPKYKKPNTDYLKLATSKFICSAYLWQAFTAEQMRRNGFGRRTFRFEEEYTEDTMTNRDNYKRMNAKVHIVRTERSVAEIRHVERSQQWSPPPGYKFEFNESQYDIAGKALDKYGGPFDQRNSHYVSALSIDSTWSPSLKIALGHAALGGGYANRRLGVFGSHLTFAWPSCLEEVFPCFNDTTKVDTNYLSNDGNSTNEYWRAANVGMGAFLHETGHLLTMPHTPSGIMSRGFDNFNRTFCIMEPRNQGPILMKDEDGSHWHKTDINRLRYHPLTWVPGDKPLPKESGGVTSYGTKDGIYVTSKNGIHLIEGYVNDSYRWHKEYTAENLEKRKNFIIKTFSETERMMETPTSININLDDWKKLMLSTDDSDIIKLEMTTTSQDKTEMPNVSDFIAKSRRSGPNGLVQYCSLSLGRDSKTTFSGTAHFLSDTGIIRNPNSRVGPFPSALKSITVRYHRSYSLISAMEFKLADNSTVKIGNYQQIGRSSITFDIPQNDGLQTMVVRSGAWIDGVEFITRNGKKSGWIGGNGGGISTLSAPPGYVITGLNLFYDDQHLLYTKTEKLSSSSLSSGDIVIVEKSDQEHTSPDQSQKDSHVFTTDSDSNNHIQTPNINTTQPSIITPEENPKDQENDIKYIDPETILSSIESKSLLDNKSPLESESKLSKNNVENIDPELSTSEKLRLEEWVTQAEKELNRKKAEEGLDYYAILNINRNAEDEEIREAYKKRSRLFHPDKHTDSQIKEWASSQFRQIQNAYEVLIDPIKRAAYDVLGEKGVSTKWEVGSRHMSKFELQQEFERKIRSEKEKDIASLINSKSEILVGINAALLTSNALREILLDRGVIIRPIQSFSDMYKLIQRQQFVTKHNFMIPFGDNVITTISGTATLKGKNSAGNIGISTKYSPGPGVTNEVSLSILAPQTATIKRSVQINSGSFYNFQSVFQTLDISTPPSITATYGQLVSKSLTGFLTVRTGNQYHFGEIWEKSPTRVDSDNDKPEPQATRNETQSGPSGIVSNKSKKRVFVKEFSGVTFGLAGQYFGDVQVNSNVTFSIPQQQLSFNATKQIDSTFSISGGITFVSASFDSVSETQNFSNPDVPLTSELQAVLFNVGGDMAISEYEQFGYKIEFGINSGTTLHLSYGRLGQNLRLPVLLSPVLEIDVLFYSLLVPTTLAFGYNVLILRPRKLLKLKQRILDLENEFRQGFTLKKKESEKVIKLMASICEQKVSQESKIGGLVITKALFGDVSHLYSTSTEKNEYEMASGIDTGIRSVRTELANIDRQRAINVTDILMSLVSNSQLVIPAPKNGLQSIVGFYNPLADNLASSLSVPDDNLANGTGFWAKRTLSKLTSHIGLVLDSLPNISSIFLGTSEGNKPFLSGNLGGGAMSLLEQVSKVQPKLYIEYTFRNRKHKALINNSSSIILPLEAHAY